MPRVVGEISQEHYTFLQQYVYRTSGIVLDESKHYLLQARLESILDKEDLASIGELCEVIRKEKCGRISQEVAEAMTTNETFFFRDEVQFRVLQNTFLPPLIKARSQSKTLAFWSAASSSGQEALSLAIILCEMGLQDWNIEIHATDFNQQMVERARQATYIQVEINRGLPKEYLLKYFDRHTTEWRANTLLRRMVHFKKFDLRQSMKMMGPFDFVFCRNVLIYFDPETKKRILDEIQKTIHSGGYLFLGAAESSMYLPADLTRQKIEGLSVYKKT